MRQFVLPDLGEGLEEAEIVNWHVNEGDHVVTDQPLVSVETDKAVVEVPSPSSGRIQHLFGVKGDVVKVGAPLVEFAEGPEQDTGTIVGELGTSEPPAAATPSGPAAGQKAQVFPAVRALARKLDVDLELVEATGPGGFISRADVERAAKTLSHTGPAEPLRGLRRAMAQRMTAAHAEIVPAGVTDEADIDDWRTGEDVTIRLVRAIAVACKAEPSLNAWYNSGAGERRLIDRIDLGIAVDTGGGLIVPVLRNVAERDISDLRAGLDRMRADAVARSIPPGELRGATITLSNFGMIGGRFASLIVVPPQVAIIGAGRITQGVVAYRGQPAVRRVLPLSLTFDHRVVTGGEAARFLVALKSDLEQIS
ncbi:dihydrolipoamide acetyltransferase family protein [Bradyrhizobium valentinum]|uniref:Dihydrolipoamide acetyltransferase component of pyruvate dehydrogenase complex n=1 Tax=Bradyrhizobium valentinum TaxID=1518501 RepID=A0A0R3M142_9BRAD|nr:dihydrolipoamide acetyltransferase family protein [Bradyrhizobium valentinum]KRQ92429.1 branched-chain alpha-keto acid dehydrogenase subunit E2 [Bradyrhizobium valentinum]KRR13793.1 branched-chain alpha-keto acid dehydrogenase subunit E2 [Bradyrhizobium valentinum]